MVVAMMRRPPDRPALHGRGTQQAEDELTDARCLEAAVREIAMIEAGDGEHAHDVQRQSDDECGPAEAYPNHRETGRVHQQKGYDPGPIDVPARLPLRQG